MRLGPFVTCYERQSAPYCFLLRKYRRIIILSRVPILPSDLLSYYNKHKKDYITEGEIRASQFCVSNKLGKENALKKINSIL